MQRSKLDMRGADAGAGGMSISSGMGASSSSSDASAMAQSTRVFWSGLRLDVPGEELIVGVERRGLCDGFFAVGIAVGAQATPTGCPSMGRASWRDEAQHDVNFSFMAVIVASLAWMLAVSQRRIHACPSLLGFITSSRVVASCRIVVVVSQPSSTRRRSPS